MPINKILEKPANPLGRAIIWALVAFFCITVLWAIFGHVDMVASTMGRTVPTEQVKLIQPAEMGVVRAIHVRDGQHVKKGEALLDLDRTFTGADEDQASQNLLIASVVKARTDVLQGYFEGKDIKLQLPKEAANSSYHTQTRLIKSQIGEFEANSNALNERQLEIKAELSLANSELEKLQQVLPLIGEQLKVHERLQADKTTSRTAYLELKERHINQVQNIAIQKQQMIKLRASSRAVTSQLEQIRQEFISRVTQEMVEAEDKITLAQAELDKAERRSGLQTLTSPVDGIVQQLAIHTIGGVVQPAEPVMVIVPGDGKLIVEAMVLNKDIGFVHVGDSVEIKLETFPFTKYGMIPGEIITISSDAIQDEDLGLVYAAKIEMKKQTIYVRGRDVKLSPGMSLQAEIKTGERRIIEFLLSPLMRYRDESLRER
jgi:hemolysin D